MWLRKAPAITGALTDGGNLDSVEVGAELRQAQFQVLASAVTADFQLPLRGVKLVRDAGEVVTNEEGFVRRVK